MDGARVVVLLMALALVVFLVLVAAGDIRYP